MHKLVFALASGILLASSANALFAPVPLEILVDEADLIVVGKVTKIQDSGFAIGARRHDVAVVDVSGIVKSRDGKPKEVRIAQPAADGLAVSTDITFQAGQEGIWLLTKDQERNVYWAKHPSQFQETKQQKELADLVVLRAKLPGGKPVQGLVARAELVEHKPVRGPISYEVRFSVKNVSDQAITICDYVGNRPLRADWVGPDGKLLKSNHYDWLARADIADLMKNNFATIAPGGVRFLGARGPYSGVWFQGQQSPHANHAAIGQHRVTMSYAGKENGQQFRLDDVWVGTVTANEVTFTVR